MVQSFYERLRDYYLNVAKVLRGESDAASIFPNTTDIGSSRERVYAEFLKQHVPSKCNVFFGGFLFDDGGQESKQLDIIVTTDTAPQFNLHKDGNSGKSFSPVEGTLGVVSVKSNLDKKETHDALLGIASIPPTKGLEGRVNALLKIPAYENWPLKIVYASRGVDPKTLERHVGEFYRDNSAIPLSRRPDIIHVAGSCLMLRSTGGMEVVDLVTKAKKSIDVGGYMLQTVDVDLYAIAYTLHELQLKAVSSSHIIFSYNAVLGKICGWS